MAESTPLNFEEYGAQKKKQETGKEKASWNDMSGDIMPQLTATSHWSEPFGRSGASTFFFVPFFSIQKKSQYVMNIMNTLSWMDSDTRKR